MNKEYKNPALTVDIIVENDNHILMIIRKSDTFDNHLALPGGFVDYGETVESAAIREAMEEVNIAITPLHILGVYSHPDRDPRGHVISICFVCSYKGEPIAGDDAGSYQWVSLDKIQEEKLAFDHSNIIADYISWKISRETYWSSRNR